MRIDYPYDIGDYEKRQSEFEKVAVDYAKAYAASGREPGEGALKGLAERLLAAFDDAECRNICRVSCDHVDRYGGDPLKTNRVLADFSSDGVWGHVEFTKDRVVVHQETYSWGFVSVGPDDCEKDVVTEKVSEARLDARCIGGFLESSMAHMDTPEVVAKRQEVLDLRAAQDKFREAIKNRDLPACIAAAEKLPAYKGDFSRLINAFFLTSPNHHEYELAGVSLRDGGAEWIATPILKIPHQKSADGTPGSKYVADGSLSVSGKGSVCPRGNGNYIFRMNESRMDFPDELADVFFAGDREAFQPDILGLLRSCALTSVDPETEPVHRGAVVVNANWLLERVADFDDYEIGRQYLDEIEDPDDYEYAYEAACREALARDVEDGLLHVEIAIADGTNAVAYAVGEGSECCGVVDEDEKIPLTPTEQRVIFDHFETELIAAKDAACAAELDNELEM